MRLSDLISKERVHIDKTALSKTAVLFQLSQILAQTRNQLDTQQLFDAFWNRESLGSTTIGHGVTIPHVRVDHIDQSYGCFLKLDHPIDFGAEDKQPVDLVFGLIVPTEQAEQHLTTLAMIAKLFSDQGVREYCRLSENNESLYHQLIASATKKTSHKKDPLESLETV